MAKSVAKNQVRKAFNTLKMLSTLGGVTHPWWEPALDRAARNMVRAYLHGRKESA